MAGETNPLVLGPVLIPMLGAALCLLLSHHNTLQRIIALAAGIGAALCSIFILQANLAPESVGVQLYRLGGWMTPTGIVLVADKLAALLCLMGTLVLAAGLLYCLQSRDHSLTYPVFMPAFLFMGAGLSGCFLTGDIFTFFVFMELMVMSSVVMVAVADNRLGLEAAIKYVFISGIGSVLLLLAIAAFYSTFGTLTIAQVAQAFSTGERPLLALPAVVMLMISFLIKSAVVPFHFWQPDFHTTAPTPVSGLLSSVIVKVGIYGIIRITTAFLTQEVAIVQNILIVLGLVGIFFGGLAALRTWNAKRMLAYSTLGQVGFILVAIGWGSELALVAAIIYMFNHAFIKSGMLMLTGAIASHNAKHSADLNDLNGAGKGLWLQSGLYLCGGLALAGVPPFNGFISKVALLRSGASVESWLPLGLIVAGGLLTIIYVIRTWQHIFQQPEPETVRVSSEHHDSSLAPALLISACVLLGVYATPLVNLAEDTAAQVYDPSIYACSVLAPMVEGGWVLAEGGYTCDEALMAARVGDEEQVR